MTPAQEYLRRVRQLSEWGERHGPRPLDPPSTRVEVVEVGDRVIEVHFGERRP